MGKSDNLALSKQLAHGSEGKFRALCEEEWTHAMAVSEASARFFQQTHRIDHPSGTGINLTNTLRIPVAGDENSLRFAPTDPPPPTRRQHVEEVLEMLPPISEDPRHWSNIGADHSGYTSSEDESHDDDYYSADVSSEPDISSSEDESEEEEEGIDVPELDANLPLHFGAVGRAVRNEIDAIVSSPDFRPAGTFNDSIDFIRSNVMDLLASDLSRFRIVPVDDAVFNLPCVQNLFRRVPFSPPNHNAYLFSMEQVIDMDLSRQHSAEVCALHWKVPGGYDWANGMRESGYVIAPVLL